MNSLGQLRAKAAPGSGTRLVLNTTVGIPGFFDPAVFAIYGINYRSEIQFTYEEFDSPFSYDVIRFLYTRKRELQLQWVY